ncbi:LacI family DNA-binding transcriptional regulator [Micromonospora sp. SL4-19]
MHRLKEVAERAGVSVTTMSNVVNGYQLRRAPGCPHRLALRESIIARP